MEPSPSATASFSEFRGRILVTGASGFIGSHLCTRLRDYGGEVHGVSRGQCPSHAHDVRWWYGDLADLETVQKIMAAVKPDVIFHLSSHVAGGRELGLVLPTFRSNLMSTVHLFTVAGEMGCRRIVVAGSMEEPKPEQSDAIPSSPYAAAKWAGSAYGRMFHALFRLPVVLLRVFMVYGPGQRDVRKLIPYVTLSLLRGDPPKLTSGTRWVDWIFVDDVVEGLLAAAGTPGLEGKEIDIGSGQLTQIRAVVERLVRLVDPKIVPLLGAVTDRPLEQTRVADTARSRALMGWEPRVSLEEGLQATVDWFRARAAQDVSAVSS